MKIKLITIFLLSVFFTIRSFGQNPSDYSNGVLQFINWVSNLDNILSKISEKEKLRRIYRQLGYSSEDIDNIALGKLLLANELSKITNPNQKISDKLKPQVDDIIMDVKNLLDRFDSIKKDLSGTDQIKVEQIIHSIRTGILTRKMNYLNDIKAFLYGQSIPLNKIKEEAIQAKVIAEDASIKIKEAKLKIKKILDQ